MKEEACGNCRYFKDLELTQNGLTEYIGICLYDTCLARTSNEVLHSDIKAVDPDGKPCTNHRMRV